LFICTAADKVTHTFWSCSLCWWYKGIFFYRLLFTVNNLLRIFPLTCHR
jgi:hypothetical protein